MAAANMSKDTLLKCQNCLDVYKDPRMLPCLHTFCRKCIDKAITKGELYTYNCPTCHHIFNIPIHGAIDYPKNPFMGSYSSAESSAENHPRFQDVGGDSDGEDEQRYLCHVHRGEVLDHYCDSCKMPICNICIQVKPHYGHHFRMLSDVDTDCKSELAKSEYDLSELLSSLSKESATDGDMNDKATAMSEAGAIMDDVIDKINISLKEKSSKVKKEIETLYESLQISIIDQKSSNLKRLERLRSLTQKLQLNVSTIDRLANFPEIQRALKDFTKDAREITTSTIVVKPETPSAVDLVIKLFSVVDMIRLETGDEEEELQYLELKMGHRGGRKEISADQVGVTTVIISKIV